MMRVILNVNVSITSLIGGRDNLIGKKLEAFEWEPMPSLAGENGHYSERRAR